MVSAHPAWRSSREMTGPATARHEQPPTGRAGPGSGGDVYDDAVMFTVSRAASADQPAAARGRSSQTAG